MYDGRKLQYQQHVDDKEHCPHKKRPTVVASLRTIYKTIIIHRIRGHCCWKVCFNWWWICLFGWADCWWTDTRNIRTFCTVDRDTIKSVLTISSSCTKWIIKTLRSGIIWVCRAYKAKIRSYRGGSWICRYRWGSSGCETWWRLRRCNMCWTLQWHCTGRWRGWCQSKYQVVYIWVWSALLQMHENQWSDIQGNARDKRSFRWLTHRCIFVHGSRAYSP